MDSKPNSEMIAQAIQKLLEDEKKNSPSSDGTVKEEDCERLLLSKLLSQLESMDADGSIQRQTTAPGKEAISCLAADEESNRQDENSDRSNNRVDEFISREEIAKEIKEIKKQNSITHWLLSAMILLTITWQFSEFALLLKLKDGLSHPFRSVGSLLAGMVQRSGKRVLDAEKQLEEDHGLPAH